MFNLNGKCALITGASGGLGSSIARALHESGAKVALSGTRVDPLESLAAELGEGAFVVPANLSDPDSVAALPKAAEEAMGQVDILVNNAGITRDNIAMRMKDEEWDDVMQVNLKSAFKLTQGL
ncbi:MAG: SDR family NAD(P)-dependent oxidoreductase, partial [Emcibacter sp.]|nr:SDR family NAD(P)-dependent oxidoreductase [Emcibacter sp.]